jgi:signal transduction histidine kinase
VSDFNTSAYIKRLERLVEVCRNLSKSEDVDHLLQQIVTTVCNLTGSQYSFLFVYEQETNLLKLLAGTQNQFESLTRIRVPIDKSITGWVYSKSLPAVINDARGDPRIFRDMERTLKYTTNSMAAVPLVFRGQTIGVLEAVNKRDNSPFTDDDLVVLDTLGYHAASASLNALLFEETQHAYNTARQLDQMKDNFIAIASHELRTPLGLVLGHATFLKELIKDEQQNSQIDIIIRNATRLKSIIEELASVNGFQSGTARVHIKTVSVNDLVSNICQQHQETARQKKITFEVRYLEQNIRIEGDEEKLGLAISNVVRNALTFTDSHGSVSVALELLPGYVQIKVSDDGIGIPEQELTKIFERFYQVQSHLTRRHGGMGLGLSVAKAMIEMHQGNIWAESDGNRGSSFFIMLPTTAGANINY